MRFCKFCQKALARMRMRMSFSWASMSLDRAGFLSKPCCSASAEKASVRAY